MEKELRILSCSIKRKDQLQEMQFEAAMQVEEGLGILLKYRDQIEKFIYQNPHLLQRINYY